MKKLVSISLLLTGLFSFRQAFAQQIGQTSQYMMNYYLINPAVAGTEDYTDLRLGYRYQWAGIEGTPQNYYLSAHQPLGKVHSVHDKLRQHKKAKPHHAFGGVVSGQTLGALSNYGINASYAYHLPLTHNWRLSAGAMAGVNRYALNQQKASFQSDVSDVAAASFQSWQPNMSLGLWLYSSGFFGGISLNQLFQVRFGENAQLQRHYYFTAGYQIKIDRELALIPSVLMKMVPGLANQFDVNMKMRYMQLVWGGVSYRHRDALAFMVGYTAKHKYDIGYSYDLTTSSLRRYSSGTHELVLGVKLNTGTHVYSPSDFW